jgi:hypothetical protein
MNVIVLLADGIRPDTLTRAIESGALPALARLRAEGRQYEITTVFPSVTGCAYVPFLTGRFPGPVGLPGQRWLDRERTWCSFPDYSRSYLGPQMRLFNGDLDPGTRTIFEIIDGGVGAMSIVTRGLRPENAFMVFGIRQAVRATWTHFWGGSRAMFTVDRDIAAAALSRVGQTPYLFAAFATADKISHESGQESPGVLKAMRIVDDTAAEMRSRLERAGQWDDTRLWVTSDHGHSPVSKHEDLPRVIDSFGHRTLAHPNVFRPRTDTAVMVSGNSMAHVYVDTGSRRRPYLSGMSARARALVDKLAALPSVDVLLAPEDESTCRVISAARGQAAVSRNGRCYSYTRRGGDPLGLGADLKDLSTLAAYDACAASRYPDALVQIAELALSRRSGDVVLSAATDWDFRARFEPTKHVSTHGSLRREHMMVPLLTNHVLKGVPRRTADLFPSALKVMGLPIPDGLDGSSFE